jgi:hypothetical protein
MATAVFPSGIKAMAPAMIKTKHGYRRRENSGAMALKPSSKRKTLPLIIGRMGTYATNHLRPILQS